MKVEQTLVEQTQNDILKYIADHQDEKDFQRSRNSEIFSESAEW